MSMYEKCVTAMAEGTLILFGSYFWRVLDLDTSSNKALLLSDKIVSTGVYHKKREYITWENCSLRQKLNDEFYREFQQKENVAILKTVLKNKSNPWYGADGGNDTEDYIFLLSLDEVVKYFGDSGQLEKQPDDLPYYIDDQFNITRLAYTMKGSPHWWWLRTPGHLCHRIVYVNSDGQIRIDGRGVGCDVHGIRPALWLDLDAVVS